MVRGISRSNTLFNDNVFVPHSTKNRSAFVQAFCSHRKQDSVDFHDSEGATVHRVAWCTRCGKMFVESR